MFWYLGPQTWRSWYLLHCSTIPLMSLSPTLLLITILGNFGGLIQPWSVHDLGRSFVNNSPLNCFAYVTTLLNGICWICSGVTTNIAFVHLVPVLWYPCVRLQNSFPNAVVQTSFRVGSLLYFLYCVFSSVTPELQLPCNVVPTFWMSFSSLVTNTVWYVAQISIYSFHQSNAKQPTLLSVDASHVLWVARLF